MQNNNRGKLNQIHKITTHKKTEKNQIKSKTKNAPTNQRRKKKTDKTQQHQAKLYNKGREFEVMREKTYNSDRTTMRETEAKSRWPNNSEGSRGTTQMREAKKKDK